MNILALTSQKGGSGKTTLAGYLAVAAETAGAGPVAIIDTDPQGSLTDWWNERHAKTPSFLSASIATLADDLERARNLGFRLVIIDTPPAITDMIDGRTVMELPRAERSSDEVSRLWAYLQGRVHCGCSPATAVLVVCGATRRAMREPNPERDPMPRPAPAASLATITIHRPITETPPAPAKEPDGLLSEPAPVALVPTNDDSPVPARRQLPRPQAFPAAQRVPIPIDAMTVD